MCKCDRYLGRAGLRIPQAELRQVETRSRLDRGDKILAGRGLAVVAVEIEIGAAAEPLRARHGAHHSDHLGPLVIDGRGVEIADFAIGIGPDRMRERARILGKLDPAQHADILDPFNRLAAHIGAEQLVAQDGETFLQAQLEPVAAGHAVARPIVEIFVPDHAFDPVVIAIGRGLGVGEDVFGVEDVEALVLHRAHVEIADRDDVEQVEIVFAPEHLLVPLHRALEALHRVFGADEIAFAHIDVQLDLAPAHGREVIGPRDQIACNQREEVGRLGPGIVPFGPMCVAVGALTRAVAIAQQYGELRPRPAHPHGIGAQHIGPVGEEGDPAKPFGFALRAEHAVRGIEPHQLRIVRGIEFGNDSQHMAITRQRNDQIVAIDHMPVARPAVAGERDQREPVAIQANGRRSGSVGIALDIQRGGDPRLLQAQLEFHPGRQDQPREGRVILAPDDRWCLGFDGGIGHYGIAVGRGGSARNIHGIPVECGVENVVSFLATPVETLRSLVG